MDKFKSFCLNNKKQLIMIVAAVLILVIVATVAVIANNKGKDKEEPTTKVEVTTEAETTTEEETTSNSVKSFLTGEDVSEKVASRRPVAVMINNISDALPQSGISKAGVIYEAPVEGGITRLMAIFDDYSKIKKIGSIRSCRIYYCYFALEWDAIYCHYGQSKYAVDFLKSDNIDNVSSYNAGQYYYQTSDRVPPHNTYIGESGINDAIKALKYRRKYKKDMKPHFEFADKDSPVNLSNGTAAKMVEISYPHNHPYFQYDKDSKTYLRYQLDSKHMDEQTKKQLSCKNIIVQFVKSTLYPDGKSLDITLTGSGEGYYVTEGKAIDIKWKKDDKLGVTQYTDAKTGQPITLNTGKTWICIVDNDTKVDISE